MPEPAASSPRRVSASDLTRRLATAAVVIPILLYALYRAPVSAFLIFCGAVGVPVAASELAGMTLPGRRVQQVWVVVGSIVVFAVVCWQPTATAVAATAVGVVTCGFVMGLVQPEPIDSAGARMAWLVTIPMYAGGVVATLPLLHRLDEGGSWVVLAMVLAWLGDTTAYFAGKLLGRRKLFESVSPKKTVAGAVGGLVGSVGGAVAMSLFALPVLPVAHAVGLGLCAGVAGQAGDLTISLVKRSANVKDTGWVVPGHGGLLDRIDGLMMTSAVTWAYTALVAYPAGAGLARRFVGA